MTLDIVCLQLREHLCIGIRRDSGTDRNERNEPIDQSFYAGALPSEFVKPLALLRTDLDRFLPEDTDLLPRQLVASRPPKDIRAGGDRPGLPLLVLQTGNRPYIRLRTRGHPRTLTT